MANTKDIKIVGILPFNCTEHEGLCMQLGMLNSPTMGLKVSWDGEPSSYVPSGIGGGKTAMYKFMICGVEAVRLTWIRNLLKQICDAGGTIEKAEVVDLDDDNQKYDLLKS